MWFRVLSSTYEMRAVLRLFLQRECTNAFRGHLIYVRTVVHTGAPHGSSTKCTYKHTRHQRGMRVGALMCVCSWCIHQVNFVLAHEMAFVQCARSSTVHVVVLCCSCFSRSRTNAMHVFVCIADRALRRCVYPKTAQCVSETIFQLRYAKT